MNPIGIIARKRDGEVLSDEQIRSLVLGYVAGEVADYQMAAWAMAVYLRGMNLAETAALTRAMLHSGQILADGDRSTRVDKHSTGGIGDKTSLIVAPLLACCGLRVPMLSGRGLAPTGGTLDKLASIPGFRTDLSADEIDKLTASLGCVITGATAELVPADRKLYALRDVTATIGSIPLVTASILSKKLAENLSALVLDVKFGSGAFMKTRAQARELALSLVEVGALMGLETTALLTSMNQPNGRMIGNAVEIDEALDTLAGRGPADLRELCLALAGEVLLLKALAADPAAARAQLIGHLDSGRAAQKFAAMVAAQGGQLDAPRARAPAWPLAAGEAGYVTSIDGARLGMGVVELGGGRKQLSENIDHSVGIEVLVRLGEHVERGQAVLNVFAAPAARARALSLVEGSVVIGAAPDAVEPLIAERVSAKTRPAC